MFLIQLIPAGRSNPPVTGEIAAPADVAPALRRACYDCHSNETRWPWYSRVAPISWFIVHDVNEGRDELNFSQWTLLKEKKQIKLRSKIWEEIEEGEMPPFKYLLFHPEARLTDAERTALRAWSETADAQSRYSGDGRHDEDEGGGRSEHNE
ncbi:MAG: hypothetical protein Kow0059_00020 [Candidatus Sumerlaeia bacterium]